MGKRFGVLTIQCYYHMHGWSLHDRVRPDVVTVGLHGVSHPRNVRIDHVLLTSLVERWFQESHPFHLLVSWATFTLEDAAILLGLRMRQTTSCENKYILTRFGNVLFLINQGPIFGCSYCLYFETLRR